MTTIPEGSIIITPAEVYGEVKALTDQVRLLLARDEADTSERATFRDELTDLKKRVQSLEHKILLASGFCAALGSGIGVAASKALGA